MFKNTPHQYMTLYLWVLQIWRDEFLWWDPGHYGGVESLVLSEDNVWLPDMNLENKYKFAYFIFYVHWECLLQSVAAGYEATT